MTRVYPLFRVIMGALCLILTAAAALACTLPPDLRTNERPPGAGPTEITAAFYVLDFLGVDDVNQQINVDIETHFKWQDARLVGLEGCRFGVTEVWFPQVLMVNSSALRTARNQALNQVVVRDGGAVSYRQRYTGQVSSYHNLRKFPFDEHRFGIKLVSSELPKEHLVFVADHDRTFISPRLNVEGWNVIGVQAATGDQYLHRFDETLSTLELTIEASRDSMYYASRIILLMLFVTAMSWTVFWVHPSKMEFQMSLGATSMLTIIAFNIAISSSLPRLGYLTILDKMMIWSIFLVFMSIVEGLTAGLLVSRGREATAVRLDKASRVGFPAAMILGWILIATTA